MTMRSRFHFTLFVFALLLGCNTVTVEPSGGGNSGASATTGAGGAAQGGADAGVDAKWTDCSSPAGFQVCGGTHDCPQADCSSCMDPKADHVNLCVNDAVTGQFSISQCYLCRDGGICFLSSFNNSPGAWTCASYDVGVLFAGNGGADMVRYSDYGLWSGQPLPEPATCPKTDGVTLCGGQCGGCPVGQVCTGRSALHPYGMCIADDVGNCDMAKKFTCQVGEACLFYVVEPEAQPLADQNGYCLPIDACEKTAANLPGGSKCVKL